MILSDLLTGTLVWVDKCLGTGALVTLEVVQEQAECHYITNKFVDRKVSSLISMVNITTIRCMLWEDKPTCMLLEEDMHRTWDNRQQDSSIIMDRTSMEVWDSTLIKEWRDNRELIMDSKGTMGVSRDLTNRTVGLINSSLPNNNNLNNKVLTHSNRHMDRAGDSSKCRAGEQVEWINKLGMVAKVTGDQELLPDLQMSQLPICNIQLLLKEDSSIKHQIRLRKQRSSQPLLLEQMFLKCSLKPIRGL